MSKDKYDMKNMDLEAYMNLRDWVQSAIEDKGGLVKDKGIGIESVDLGFELDEMMFNVTVTPRL